MEEPLNDDFLAETVDLLNSLTWNGSSPFARRHEGPSKAEVEQCQRDIMEQRIQMQTCIEKYGNMEEKIAILQTESAKSHSEIANLRLLLETERKGKAEIVSKIKEDNATLQKVINVVGTLIPKVTAVEESIKVLKEQVSTSKLDEDAIEALATISNEINVRFTEANENHEKAIGDIQILKDAVANLDKQMQLSSELSQLKFSKVNEGHEKVMNELWKINVALNELEMRMKAEILLKATEANNNRSNIFVEIENLREIVNNSNQQIKSDIQLKFTNIDKNQSRVTDEIQKLYETVVELNLRVQSIKSDVTAALPVSEKGDDGDGSDSDIVVVTVDDEDEQKEKRENVIRATPESSFTLSSVASKFRVSSGRKGASIIRKNPELTSTAPPATKKQNVQHRLDKSKRNGTHCICGRRFNSKSNLQSHVLYYTSEKKFFCTLCPQSFIWLGYLRKHQISKHKINPENATRGCRKCGKLCDSFKELMNHLKKCKGGRLKKLPKEPMVLRPSPPKASTKTSSTSSTNTAATAERTLGHHGKDFARPMFCLCGKKFRLARGLDKHLEYYNGEKKYFCKVCAKGFSYLCRLTEHVRKSCHAKKTSPMTASRVSIKTNNCQKCGKPFRTVLELANHLRTVHQVRSRMHKFPRAVDINGQEHRLVSRPPISSSSEAGSVQDPNRFYCKCGKSYSMKQQVVLHIRLIGKQRAFKCSVLQCPARFDVHYGLKRHLKVVHDIDYAQGKYACVDCGETFDIRQLYNAHRLAVHGI